MAETKDGSESQDLDAQIAALRQKKREAKVLEYQTREVLPLLKIQQKAINAQIVALQERGRGVSQGITDIEAGKVTTFRKPAVRKRKARAEKIVPGADHDDRSA